MKSHFNIFLGLCLCLRAAAINAEEPLKVGVLLPLTGEFATWGERVRQGLVLAAEDTKHRFELDFQDEGNCDPKIALQAVQKFLNINKTKVAFVGCLAGAKATGALFKSSQALMLSTGLLDDDVYRRNYPVISLATQISTQAKVLAKHIASKGVKRAAIVRWPDAFGEELARALQEQFKTLNVEVVLDEYLGTMNADFASLVMRVKAQRSDALVVQLGDAHFRNLMQQLKNLNLNIPVFSDYTAESNAPAIEILNGIEYTYPINATDGTPAKVDFDKRFAQHFGGVVPTANTYFAYDGLRALDLALEMCSATDASCIKNHIIANMISGLSGSVEYNADGSNVRPYGIKRVSDSRYVWLTK